MTSSQNGWPASPTAANIGVTPFSVAGVSFPGGVRSGPVAVVLEYVVAQFHARVERLQSGACWGYAYRDVRQGSSLSNHASGTAVDINAPAHPLGTVGTFNADQVNTIHRILSEVDHVVRWGGDYSGRKDEMHFEINAGHDQVAAVATRLEDTMSGEGLNIERILTGANAPSMAQLTLDETGHVNVPPGMTKDGLAYRIADIQWAMTRAFPEILGELKALRAEVAALKGDGSE